MPTEKPVILLLHPDDCYRAMLSYVLRRHDFEMREASAPGNCNQACRGTRPSLIITDWSFCPNGPGDLLATFHKEPILYGVPAILIGPPPSRDLIKAAAKQGVAAIVIPQGFTIEGFIAKIRSVIGKGAP